MSDLPEPPIPPGAELTDFPYTPIFRARLFGSRFHARVTDSEWRAGVTLWMKSWDQIPAGSLPDDDIDLCRLAELGRDLRQWARLKVGALHGWYKCSDGLLYHDTVAEGINEALGRKRKQSDRGAKGAEARWHKHRANMAQASETDASSIDVGCLGQCETDGTSNAQAMLKNGNRRERKEIEEPPYSPPRGPKPTRARSGIAEDWRPEDIGAAYAKARGVNIEREIPSFRNHHAAKGSLMADWSAAWRTWCDNAVKFGNATGKPEPKNQGGHLFTQMTGGF